MNNNIELPDPELTVLDPSVKPTDARIGKEGKIVLIVIAAICVLICLCSLACIAMGAFGIGSVVKENAPIKTVLETFMQDMTANDITSAYDLFSPRSQNQTTMDDLRNLRSGNNAVLFQGVDGIRIHGLNIETSVTTDANAPQGLVANVSGTIKYENGKTGQFEAVLEKVDGEWMLYSIDLWLGTSNNSLEDVSV